MPQTSLSHVPIQTRTLSEVTSAAPQTGTLERLPGGGYAYTLAHYQLRIEGRFLRRQFSDLVAEFDVQCGWPGAKTHRGSLSCATLNLSSQPARKALAAHCASRARTAKDFDWLDVIDGACLEIIRAERTGDTVIVLDDAPTLTDRDFDIDGLRVPADATSILIAHGDSLKSMLMLYVLGRLAQRGHTVLYCDWEWSAERHKARKQRLFGDDRLETLRYLNCRQGGPLVQQLARIQQYCHEHAVAFIGVDSVGLACDGKLNDDDVAIRFHRALSMLPPALCAAHVPKSSLSPDAKGDAIGPFGSVFFSNLCRASWLVKKQPSDENCVTVGLFPQKQNVGPRPPVGFEFTFSPSQMIFVRPVDLADVEGLSEKLTLDARIKALLKKSGPLTLTEIANELGGAKVDSVTKSVDRHPKDFIKLLCSNGVKKVTLPERDFPQ